MREIKKDIAGHIIDNIENYIDTETDELHFHLFNEDYYIVGYRQAEEFLQKEGIFQCIKYIKQYEQDNFGEFHTDFSDSEKVANMMAYIIGEEVLNEFDFDEKYLTKKKAKEIVKTLKENYIS